ncbi:unnamed protein product [Peniophora sp. CBMAI 1063]|nr:unnamed protein product [Peniophora sp. CBMAI 1063]
MSGQRRHSSSAPVYVLSTWVTVDCDWEATSEASARFVQPGHVPSNLDPVPSPAPAPRPLIRALGQQLQVLLSSESLPPLQVPPALCFRDHIVFVGVTRSLHSYELISMGAWLVRLPSCMTTPINAAARYRPCCAGVYLARYVLRPPHLRWYCNDEWRSGLR